MGFHRSIGAYEGVDSENEDGVKKIPNEST
jgi:hypothetical protein